MSRPGIVNLGYCSSLTGATGYRVRLLTEWVKLHAGP